MFRVVRAELVNLKYGRLCKYDDRQSTAAMATRAPGVGLAQDAAAASNAFAVDVFRVLSERGSPGNIFFSPMSIFTALAMAFAGARGQTAGRQMSEMLRSNSSEGLGLYRSFADLVALAYRADASYTLQAANRLFGSADLNLQATGVVEESKTYHGANLETLDFAGDGEGSRQRINSWVEEQTASRIKDLLSPGAADASARLVPVNAVRFKGDWAAKFQHRHTLVDKKSGTAAAGDGPGPVGGAVPLMHQRGRFNYARDDTASSFILELPFDAEKDRAAASMFVVLPDRADGLADLRRNLSRETIDGWVALARSSDRPTVIVSLPKLSLQQDFVLREDSISGKVGWAAPLGRGRGDSSVIATVSPVIHGAFLEVNEGGSEAGGASALGKGYSSCSGDPPTAKPLEFKANRPFLLFIYEHKWRAVLFMGQICHPAQ